MSGLQEEHVMKKSMQSIILEDTFYTIAAANGKVLEVANFNTENGAAIQLWDYSGHPWQQWRFESVGSDIYRIRNRFTDKCIDLALRGTVEGTLLHQWSPISDRSQQWKLENGGRGTRIRSVRAGKCIDLAEMSTANGARAQIWTDVENGNQEWVIKRVNDKKKKDAKDTPEKTEKKASNRKIKGQTDILKSISGSKTKETKSSKKKSKK